MKKTEELDNSSKKPHQEYGELISQAYQLGCNQGEISNAITNSNSMDDSIKQLEAIIERQQRSSGFESEAHSRKEPTRGTEIKDIDSKVEPTQKATKPSETVYICN